MLQIKTNHCVGLTRTLAAQITTICLMSFIIRGISCAKAHDVVIVGHLCGFHRNISRRHFHGQ